jgi:glycosyltransferase involved in cell wall biosynthesis
MNIVKVTIILTTLNSEKFIERSLESCLTQTHPDLELLVVDGGSTDQTLEIVTQYRDHRIRIINQIDNEGKLPGAINLGLEHATGEMITWTQDDCWYEPNAIEVMHNYLVANNDVGLVYADYYDVDESGNRIQYQTVHPPEDILKDDVIRSCFLFRREVYETVGPQNPDHHPVHEVPWRIKITRYFKIYPIHVPLMYYVVRQGSLTGRTGNRILWRMTARVLLDEGIFDKRMYRQSLAQADMNQAFIEFIHHENYRLFRKYALSGIWLDWRFLLDRGIIKFLVVSFLPVRKKYREQKKQEAKVFLS